MSAAASYTSQLPRDGMLLRNYERAGTDQKNAFKRIFSQMIETNIDFAESFAYIHEMINKPQYSTLRSQPTFDQKLDVWYAELINSNMNYRKGLGRLLSDLKYIIGIFPGSDPLYADLEVERENIKKHWDSLLEQRYPLPAAVESKNGEIMKVVYPSYRPSAPPMNSTPPMSIVQAPSTPPRANGGIQMGQLNSTPNRGVSVDRMVTHSITSSAIVNNPSSVRMIQQPEPVFQSPIKRSSSVTIGRESSPGFTTVVPYQPGPSNIISRPSYSSTMVRPSSPAPQVVSGPRETTSTRVFVIDPVTGERREKMENIPTTTNYVSAAPITTTTFVAPAQTTTFVTSPQTTTYVNAPQPQPTTTYITSPQPTTTTYMNSQLQPTPNNQVTSSPGPNRTTFINQPSPGLAQSQVTTSSVSNVPTGSTLPPPPQLDAKTIQMIDEAKKDFGRPSLEIFQVEDNPSKVEVSRDGKRILYGGDNLGIAEVRNNWIVNDGVVFDNKCCTIKSMENGDILLNNFDTWDMVLLDRNCQEKGRLTGKGRALPENYKRVRTRSAEDDKHLLWLSAPEHLSVVHTATLTSDEIRNFWSFGGRVVQPQACAISPSGKKIVGIGNVDRSHTLHYYDGTDAVAVYTREDIHNRCIHWESLEISYDEDVFFIGGSDTSFGDHGTGYLLALSLTENADLIRDKTFPGVRTISALRRHNEGDILFAGALRTIFVVFWNSKQFHILNQVTIPIDKIPRDLAFNPNDLELYAVYESDKAAAIYFEEGTQRGKNVGSKPQVSQRSRRKLGQAPVPIVQAKQEPTPYDPMNQGYLTIDQRLKMVKKPPMNANLFGDYKIKVINMPGGKLILI